MDIIENGSDEQKTLDMEFRKILRILKPYIPCVMNNDYLTYYRLWLEKLSEVDASEKQERNHYLIELCYQIQDGILEYPFTQLPTPGPLPPFSNNLRTSQELTQKQLFEYDMTPINLNVPQSPRNTNYTDKLRQETEYQNETKPPLEQKTQYASNTKSLKVLKSPIPVDRLNKPYKRRNLHTISKVNQKQKIPQKNDYGLQYDEPNFNLNQQQEVTRDKQFNFKNNKQFIQEQFSTNSNYLYLAQNVVSQPPPARPLTADLSKRTYVQENIINVGLEIDNDDADDETSWYDLSDANSTATTSTIEAAGDSNTSPRDDKILIMEKTYEIYENKILELMDTISELQKQNLDLNKDVAKFEQDLSSKNTKAEASLHNIAQEVKSLKTRLQELAEIKLALKNSQIVVATQWETTVHSLNKELAATQNNNEALNTEINSLKKKLDEVNLQKQKDNAALRQKLADLHGKEMEMLKQNHAMQTTEMENRFNQKTNELVQQYENKVSELTGEYKKIIKLKNLEIQRLELMINTQCRQMHEEVSKIRSQMEGNATIDSDENLEKVTVLQKCVAKMDRLFKKSEKSFLKQITKLKHEVEMRDKIIQIQLSSQKAELVSASNTDRQIEVDTTVVQLEERYKKLLETQQAHFLSDKKHDCKIIAELRALLAKTNADKI